MLESWLGLALILVAAGVYLAGVLPRKKVAMALRPISALVKLRRALGLSVEEGTRMHVSLGRANFLTPANASGLTALSALQQITRMSAISDRPPIATSGDPVLALLSQDAAQAVNRQQNSADDVEAARSQLAGVTPFAYAVGALPVIGSELVSANLLLGGFGAEAALLLDEAERSHSFLLGASDSLTGQSILAAGADEVLYGEEVFAVPAYLRGGEPYQASLRAQDVLRWVVIAVLVIGSILTLLGFNL